MKPLSQILFCGLLGVLSASPAFAAGTASVEYLVRRKPLLVAATTGTETFVFGFHADDKCDSAAYVTSVVSNDRALRFERVRIERIGARRTEPDQVRIVARIEDVPSGAPFLRVTGPGIAAAEDDCQYQAGLAAPVITSLPFVDPELMDRLLAIAEASSIQRLSDDLEKRMVPPGVLCELTAEILAQSGAGVGQEVCANGIDPAGAALLEDLLGNLFAMLR